MKPDELFKLRLLQALGYKKLDPPPFSIEVDTDRITFDDATEALILHTPVREDT